MAYQTQMNGRAESPIRRAARNMADVWRDGLTLAELQTRLFAIELSSALRRSRIAGAVAAGGAVLALASLPIVLVAIACFLIDAGLSPAASFGITGASALVLAIILLAMGWAELSRNMRDFPRSGVELKRNFDWLKETMHQDL